MSAPKIKFVVKRHKPEAPEKQKHMIKSLQHDVLQWVDDLVPPSRQPRTVAGWDDGELHDFEVKKVKNRIAHEIWRVFLEALSTHNDSYFEMDGLLSESRRRVATLEKIVEDKRSRRLDQRGGSVGSGICNRSATGADPTDGLGAHDDGGITGLVPTWENRREIIAMDKATMIAHLEALHNSEQKVDGVMKQLDANRQGLEDTKQKLKAAMLDGRDGDYDGGRRAMEAIEEKGSEGGNGRGVPDDAKSEETQWGAVTGWSDTQWSSDDLQSTHLKEENASKSTKSRRITSTRPFAESDDYRAPAIGSARQFSKASKVSLEKFGGSSGGGGWNEGAVAAPTAVCDNLWSSMEAPQEPMPTKTRRYFETSCD